MTWRCETCGKVANSALKPHHHIRRGEHCGPFQAAAVGVSPYGVPFEGDIVPAAPTFERPTVYRQSLLRSFEVCPRRALHELQIDPELSVGNVGATGDLGSAMHAVFREILTTMRRHGEAQMPTQEGIEVMYSVLAGGDWVLPTDEREDLRRFVLSFCSYYKWPRPAMALEERLFADIVCPDGKTRTLTGQPDVLVADPPDGIVCADYKSGRGRPRSPRQMPEEGEAIVGREYLSAGGTYQLSVYGLLILRKYRAASRVTLREAWLRFGERREATLGRDELEHVERELGVQMMLLDRALDEGLGSPLARPRPGHQCLTQCPVKRSCPIPAEQRGIGALDSPEAADEEAARFVVVDALREEQRKALKAYWEETGHAPRVGDGTGLFWREKENGKGREFGVFPLPVEREAVAA